MSDDGVRSPSTTTPDGLPEHRPLKPELPPSSRRQWLVRIVKWSLCLVVIAFVAKRAQAVWQDADWSELSLQPGWLLASAMAYVAGWLPSVWFWRKMLSRVAGEYDFTPTARAYYCGHLGKYVPGKATVLVIRSALMVPSGCPVRAAVLTVTFETLLMMGVGLAIALGMSPMLLPASAMTNWPLWLQKLTSTAWLPGCVVGGACLLSVPVLSRVLSWLAVKMTPRELRGSSEQILFDSRLIATGMLVLAVGWMLHGLSLGCAIGAVGGAFDPADWPRWTGAAALATVIGFLMIFAPGGLGVREGLLMETLRMQPNLDPLHVVLVPLVLRGIWFGSEIAVAAVLYFGFGPSAPQPDAPPPTLS